MISKKEGEGNMLDRFSLVGALMVTLAVCSPLAAVPQGVNLASMQGWDIVIAKDAPASEVYAAEEFHNLFSQASGVKLPIVKTTDRAERHVFIGSSQAMRASGVGFDIGEFGPEDLRIVTRDDNIAIAGGRPRGTLYGVYTFLEEYLGVRFLTHDHTHVPKVGPWRMVGPVDRFYHPPLAFRWSYYGENMAKPAFATRLRNNTITNDVRLGGKTGLVNINHSLGRQIPLAKYGKEHPEYYCEIEGKRLADVNKKHWYNEPCLTNPDVLRIVTDSVLKELAEHPEKENISVSQNDNDEYCRCPRCSAIDKREGTPMGSLLTFVNAVADEVGKKHPNVMVGTLSYWYSRRPPKTIKPRPNVQIQLCSIECCLVHPINDPNCPKNVKFCRDMNDWGKICDEVSIWNYNTNFTNYLLPCPNLRVIEPNVRYFVANHAKGVFMQAAGNAIGAELSDLRNYIISNLLWDPTRSGKQLMDEFLGLHYGRAAPPICRFINLVHDHAEASKVHPDCFGQAKEYAIDESIARAGMDAFAEAIQLAETDVVRMRVEKASICAYRAAIEPVWNLKDSAGLKPDMAERMRWLVKQFFELCRKHGVNHVSERATVEKASQRLKRVFGLEETEEF